MSRIQALTVKINKLLKIINKIKFNKVGYRYRLLDVTSETDSCITLSVLVTGIKKCIIRFKPDEIVYDDILLSEFSPCDVRAITFLSIQKHYQSDLYILKISGQTIKKGMTIFHILNVQSKIERYFDAKSLYQNYELLSQLSKKDMLSVISTAVQEQTILNMQHMEKI